MNDSKDKGGRGFGAMDPTARRAAASKGGRKSGGNFKNDRVRAAESGREGGKRSSGNFSIDRERAAAAGRKGAKSRRRSDEPEPEPE